MSTKTVVPTFFPNDGDLDAYLKKIHAIPMLDEKEEFELAKKWATKQDPKARTKLVNSHLRLVAKIAAGYRGYGLPYSDLIAEGNIGILQATQTFDPDKGFRFSTYARWWIQASIQEYVLKSWSLVKIGTTAAQKKLFFNLRKLKRKLETPGSRYMSDADAKSISEELKVTVQEVKEMDQRMAGHDPSLNVSISEHGDGHTEWIDWLSSDEPTHEEKYIASDELQKQQLVLQNAMGALNQREAEILTARRLEEPPKKIGALAEQFHLSKERVRQIELRAFEKLQDFIKKMAYKQGYAHP